MKVINQISDTIDIHIKRLCKCLSPVQRLVITVILFVIFFLASLSMIVFAAYQVGKQDGKLMQIEHISPAPVVYQSKNESYEME